MIHCIYRIRTIITSGLCFFNPLFEGALELVLQAVYILKLEILQFCRPKSHWLYSREVSIQEWVLMAQVQLLHNKNEILSDV